MTDLKNTYLIQRLEKPRLGLGLGSMKDNPFSFGGGYKNGGLSEDAMDLLRPIIAFDYMGAAEFEFGAVPEALNFIAQRAQNGTLAVSTISVPLKDVPRNWRDKSKHEPEGEATLKEGTKLTTALRPVEDWDADVCGWLELDNGFAFFLDPEMAKGFCNLFGLELPSEGLEV